MSPSTHRTVGPGVFGNIASSRQPRSATVRGTTRGHRVLRSNPHVASAPHVALAHVGCTRR